MRKPAALAASKASPSRSLVALPAYWICVALILSLVALACRIVVIL
jgi:hypothetical protein